IHEILASSLDSPPTWLDTFLSALSSIGVRVARFVPRPRRFWTSFLGSHSSAFRRSGSCVSSSVGFLFLSSASKNGVLERVMASVCIIGSGNWGSAIAKIVGANAKKQSSFDDRVTMYVYEEIINGKKLTEIINETHENVKYLPGHKIPENVSGSKIQNVNESVQN
ncbi:LOW QUALITY PROTEIN: glycerol-3-phosphate dehydrogenase [NAD(+)] 1, chloroplastic-like, partial [Formica exsecta]|uniref:LOW QUALITY PROTEIN: glycerol-3-phosphate dehydrogenase [NAD(+)] 1, chloroplastic-like n=1 Tax=Formica exsecta TaxID=72781 RepID=UPI001144A30C